MKKHKIWIHFTQSIYRCRYYAFFSFPHIFIMMCVWSLISNDNKFHPKKVFHRYRSLIDVFINNNVVWEILLIANWDKPNSKIIGRTEAIRKKWTDMACLSWSLNNDQPLFFIVNMPSWECAKCLVWELPRLAIKISTSLIWSPAYI